MILADVSGVRAALAEYGSRCAGRVYHIEPVAMDHGCFHPKLVALTSPTECHLLIGSGNLTFGGWGTNLECVEHLHPGFAADALQDVAGFLESLATSPRTRHAAGEDCIAIATELRRAAAPGNRNAGIRVIHSLDRPIIEQLLEIAGEIGGAVRLVVASPFHDTSAIDRLCIALALDRVFVHSHPHTVQGAFGANWPVAAKTPVDPVKISLLEADDRHLHAKAFEIVCRHGRIVLSGSANATMAALGANGNIELCVARIQRDPGQNWHLTPAAAPMPSGAMGEGEEHAQCGVLRAVLKADLIHGSMLTPFPSGAAAVSRLTASGLAQTGETVIDADGHFTVAARDVERDAWTAERLVLRVTASSGAVAEGFVSFSEFAEVQRRLGSVAPHLFAILASTETPEDVAAVMSWFYEHPDYISSAPNGGGAAHHPERSGEVSLASLLDPDRVEIPPAAGGDSTSTAGWRRFMELLFASFRERRGPIDGEGDGEDGPESNGDPVKPGAPPQRRHRTELDGAFVHFEKLLDLMLRGSDENRRRAFRLAHFVCDRLAPEAARVRAYLEKLIAAFLERPETLGDEEGITAATLVWATQLPNIADVAANARATRRRLLKLGADLTGSMPDMNAVQGFARALAPDFDFPSLWQHICSIRTPQEEVKALRLAGGIAYLGPSFPSLLSTAELKDITAAERKRVRFLLRYSEACPCCNLVLPSAQTSRLREAGVARATNCCGRILLCEEI